MLGPARVEIDRLFRRPGDVPEDEGAEPVPPTDPRAPDPEAMKQKIAALSHDFPGAFRLVRGGPNG